MYDTIVTLKKGTGRTLKSGGMWVYDNEIESIAGTFENGGLVTVHDFDGYFLGIGFINTNSKITVRLLSRKKGTVIDEAFLEKRARGAACFVFLWRKAVKSVSILPVLTCGRAIPRL